MPSLVRCINKKTAVVREFPQHMTVKHWFLQDWIIQPLPEPSELPTFNNDVEDFEGDIIPPDNTNTDAEVIVKKEIKKRKKKSTKSK